MAIIDLFSVERISDKSFFIPDYQRGYRWGTQQVLDLMKDLNEFYEQSQDNKTVYCLQPLVVKLDNDSHKYYVIDGQQRLTTIKILLLCLQETNTYSVEYETREGSADFLDTIASLESDWKNNPDYYHMHLAKETIVDFLKNYDDDYLQDFLKIIKKRVVFVWYESDDNDTIKVFTRLNIGKISLTESELIKALFLSSNNFESAVTTEDELLSLLEMAIEWDKIEYRLQDDRFWLFFHEVNYNKPTRIDFILDVVRNMNVESNAQPSGEMHPTFRYFYDRFKDKEIQGNKREYLTLQWKEISRIYQILEEWYNDEKLYHYIGYICALSIENIFNLLSIYLGKKKVQFAKNGRFYIVSTKGEFISYIEYIIKKSCIKFMDLNQEYEGEKQPNKTSAKYVLLLHNIQTIIDQNTSIEKEKKYALPDFIRFPFHLYKKEGWDVEHIRPNSSEDYEGDRKKSARLKYVYVLNQYQGEKIQEAVCEYMNSKEGTEEERFIALWNSVNGDNDIELSEKDKNKIWNYVLLDASTNREYGNSCFAIKREYVLKKEKGIKPRLIVKGNKASWDNVDLNEEKEAAFVPVCTKNVFSKSYTDYPDELNYWTEKDAAFYRMDIEKTLWWCLYDSPPSELIDSDNRGKEFSEYKKAKLNKGEYQITFKEWLENKQKEE